MPPRRVFFSKFLLRACSQLTLILFCSGVFLGYTIFICAGFSLPTTYPNYFLGLIIENCLFRVFFANYTSGLLAVNSTILLYALAAAGVVGGALVIIIIIIIIIIITIDPSILIIFIITAVLIIIIITINPAVMLALYLLANAPARSGYGSSYSEYEGGYAR